MLKHLKPLVADAVFAAVAVVFGLACSAAPAQTVPKILTIKRPLETAKLKPSTLVGYQIDLQKSGICHSADYIGQQPPSMTSAQWTAEARKMAHAYAAPLSDADVTQIGEYLAVTYDGAKPFGATMTSAAGAVSAPAAAVVAANTTLNVQALLASNAYLGCHAIAQKIVGSAYHDVALKYKGDAQVQAKLEASIRSGGSCKWGAVPMPAFAPSSPQELKAMAAFVLRQ